MKRFPMTLAGSLAAILLLSSTAAAADVNLAAVAKPSSSYVSGDTSLDALHDGHAPDSSHVRGQGSYGNWPTRGTQWVQYDWSQPISTRKIDVYWWDDRRGVRLPKACRLLYWDGGEFVPVKNRSGLGVVASQYNTTTFDEVRTSRLRLEMDGNGNSSTVILEGRGYKVLEAEDGGAAMQLSQGHKGPIDLLLTDVVMPELSGPELAERLLPQRPETRVLYTSGYTDHAILRTTVWDSGANFLQKPFTPDTLVQKVKEILDPQPPSN